MLTLLPAGGNCTCSLLLFPVSLRIPNVQVQSGPLDSKETFIIIPKSYYWRCGLGKGELQQKTPPFQNRASVSDSRNDTIKSKQHAKEEPTWMRRKELAGLTWQSADVGFPWHKPTHSSRWSWNVIAAWLHGLPELMQCLIRDSGST